MPEALQAREIGTEPSLLAKKQRAQEKGGRAGEKAFGIFLPGL